MEARSATRVYFRSLHGDTRKENAIVMDRTTEQAAVPAALSRHLAKDRFGRFRLTEAVRPALTRGVVPQEGFRIQTYRDPARGLRLPVLTAAISREKLFDAFQALLEPLGPVVDVIVESSHDADLADPQESEREAIDLPILASHLLDFEDLLLNDGCTGIAALNEDRRAEVHFDEHKLLYVYAPRLAPFKRILADLGVREVEGLPLLTEAEHIHCTHPRHEAELAALKSRLGVEEFAEQWSW